jgi:Cof subfamily protein (haloacid dehalogenase superfamily)
MRLLAFDIDDTLVGDDKVLQNSTREAINGCLKEGDAIALASGRSFWGAQHYLSLFGPGKKFAIGANGSAVYDEKGNLLQLLSFPFQDFLAFLKEHEDFVQAGGEIYAYTAQAVVYFKKGEFVRLELFLNPGLGEIDLEKKSLSVDEPLLKIMAATSKGEEHSLKPSPFDERHFHIIRSDPRFLEFCPLGADKAVGVEFLRKKLGISKENVYCFGDQGNDYEMIASYQGVAMGNAIAKDKEVAKFVTKSANEDGVGYAIKMFVHCRFPLCDPFSAVK